MWSYVYMNTAHTYITLFLLPPSTISFWYCILMSCVLCAFVFLGQMKHKYGQIASPSHTHRKCIPYIDKMLRVCLCVCMCIPIHVFLFDNHTFGLVVEIEFEFKFKRSANVQIEWSGDDEIQWWTIWIRIFEDRRFPSNIPMC